MPQLFYGHSTNNAIFSLNLLARSLRIPEPLGEECFSRVQTLLLFESSDADYLNHANEPGK